MKTKILSALAILLFVAASTNAQITQGKYLLGGSLSYSRSKNQPYNGTGYAESFGSNIQFGKVVKENAVAGLYISYSFQDFSPLSKTNHYGAGIFYRKYKPINKGLYFFGELEGGYWYGRSINDFKIGTNGSRSTENGANVSFVPGLSYAVCKNLQMELSMPNLFYLSYVSDKLEYTSIGSQEITTTHGNGFSAGANLNASLLNSFAIGFKFLLGK